MHDSKKGTPPSELNLDALVQLVADVLDTSFDAHPYHDDRYARWLTDEAMARQTPAEAARTEAMARELAARHRARTLAEREKDTHPVSALRTRSVLGIADTDIAMEAAALERCAPLVETSQVAAGVGRELWDGPAEQWVELPDGLPPGKYVAVSVHGDSMEPVLLAGDVVVLKVGALVRAGSLVVARADDDGYVIKRVARITPTTFELESFNPAYEPFGIPRDARRIVGVVACILRTDDRMM